jgi:hypothetical protein
VVDELIPFALGAAVVALIRPARRRVIPVTKAVGKAGLGLVAVAVGGTADVVKAVVHPDGRGAAPTPSSGSSTSTAA